VNQTSVVENGTSQATACAHWSRRQRYSAASLEGCGCERLRNSQVLEGRCGTMTASYRTPVIWDSTLRCKPELAVHGGQNAAGTAGENIPHHHGCGLVP